MANEKDCAVFIEVFGEDRWQFEAAGWRFVGLNSLIMNTGIPSEYEQEEWLQSQLSGANGKPIALFLHKPLFLMTPDDPEESGTAIRYVPQPVRSRLVEMLGWLRAAMSISAATSLTAAPAMSGHRPRASSCPNEFSP